MSFTELSIQEQRGLVNQAEELYTHYLHTLSDEELRGPSLLPGWTRGHLVGHVAANAQGMSRLVNWGCTGVEQPMFASRDARNQEIEDLSRLNIEELIKLHQQGVHALNQAWDEAEAIGDQAWDYRVKNAHGVEMPMRRTLWMRSREVWVHTTDINNGAHFEQIPDIMLRGIMAEILKDWRAHERGRNLVLIEDDTHAAFVVDEAETQVQEVHAPNLAGLVCWASGREVPLNPGRPEPPHWR